MSNIVVRVVDAYVFRKTDDGLLYLILKRAKTKRYEHLWQGVAGKIEAGESAPKQPSGNCWRKQALNRSTCLWLIM
jgi:8-oxo-dGTP pyrophosphatase MutT (NUDIX family)